MLALCMVLEKGVERESCEMAEHKTPSSAVCLHPDLGWLIYCLFASKYFASLFINKTNIIKTLYISSALSSKACSSALDIATTQFSLFLVLSSFFSFRKLFCQPLHHGRWEVWFYAAWGLPLRREQRPQLPWEQTCSGKRSCYIMMLNL